MPVRAPGGPRGPSGLLGGSGLFPGGAGGHLFRGCWANFCLLEAEFRTVLRKFLVVLEGASWDGASTAAYGRHLSIPSHQHSASPRLLNKPHGDVLSAEMDPGESGSFAWRMF